MSRQQGAPSSGSFSVDDRGFSFGAEDGEVLDVLFDGRRVWSLASDDFPANRSAVRRAPWPEPIRRQLEGRATVELRTHVAGDSLGVADVQFGSGPGRVDIVDSAGRPVALTKWGRLNRTFATSDRAAVDGYLDQVQEVLEVLRADAGRPAFLAFGSLLGAVREGKLIGHDVDVDLGYFSAFDHPADIILEGFRIERVLRARGYDPVRENGGFLALFLPQLDGTRRNLDIFTAFCHDGRLFQVHDIAVPGSEADVLPLSTVTFEGREMPAPARPEVFLEGAYGPDWRVPNPAFEFTTPRRDKRRIGGWFGGLRDRRDFWSRQYGAQADRIPRDPSPFARWVAGQQPPGVLVDVGCGNGRDTRFFAEQGYAVTGLDAGAQRVAPPAQGDGARAAARGPAVQPGVPAADPGRRRTGQLQPRAGHGVRPVPAARPQRPRPAALLALHVDGAAQRGPRLPGVPDRPGLLAAQGVR